MPQHDDALGLRHMLDYAREAVALVQNTTCDDLQANCVLSLALIRLLEIVGEAAPRVSEELRARHPQMASITASATLYPFSLVHDSARWTERRWR
jgi:uncharacterized protein with HEPN domain